MGVNIGGDFGLYGYRCSTTRLHRHVGRFSVRVELRRQPMPQAVRVEMLQRLWMQRRRAGPGAFARCEPRQFAGRLSADRNSADRVVLREQSTVH